MINFYVGKDDGDEVIRTIIFTILTSVVESWRELEVAKVRTFFLSDASGVGSGRWR